MDKTRYTDIAKLSRDFNVNEVKVYLPAPNQNDYNAGYITRFFAQRANDPASTVYEVNSTTYVQLSQNSFFTTVDLDWQIVGSVEKIKDVNFKSVKFASQKLPAVMLYLPYYLQFRKKD